MNAVSISYCGDHSKGPPQWNHKLPAEQHSEMLRDSLLYAKKEGADRLITSATAMHGHDYNENMKICFDISLQRFIDNNLGYSEGANYSIKMALDAAVSCRYLIHTCEDVVPDRGVIASVFRMIDADGLDYVGERWRDDELSTQFFGCRVDWLAENFRYTTPMPPPERYMADLIEKGGRRFKLIPRVYRHTHTYEEWRRWMTEVMP